MRRPAPINTDFGSEPVPSPPVPAAPVASTVEPVSILNPTEGGQNRVVWDEGNLERNAQYFRDNPVTMQIDEPPTPFEHSVAPVSDSDTEDEEEEEEAKGPAPPKTWKFTKCSSCETAGATHEIVPCRHRAFCEPCARRIATGGKCTICKNFFRSVRAFE